MFLPRDSLSVLLSGFSDSLVRARLFFLIEAHWTRWGCLCFLVASLVSKTQKIPLVSYLHYHSLCSALVGLHLCKFNVQVRLGLSAPDCRFRCAHFVITVGCFAVGYSEDRKREHLTEGLKPLLPYPAPTYHVPLLHVPGRISYGCKKWGPPCLLPTYSSYARLRRSLYEFLKQGPKLLALKGDLSSVFKQRSCPLFSSLALRPCPLAMSS